MLWLAAAIALMWTALVLEQPWSKFALLGAVGALVVSMEREVARRERATRKLRRQK
jgi:hypothetical protein